jgi:hypothetical protein
MRMRNGASDFRPVLLRADGRLWGRWTNAGGLDQRRGSALGGVAQSRGLLQAASGRTFESETSETSGKACSSRAGNREQDGGSWWRIRCDGLHRRARTGAALQRVCSRLV